MSIQILPIHRDFYTAALAFGSVLDIQVYKYCREMYGSRRYSLLLLEGKIDVPVTKPKHIL